MNGCDQYRHLAGYLPNNPSTFPSQNRLLEGTGPLERGRKRPCVEPRTWSQEDGQLSPMSPGSPQSFDVHVSKQRQPQQIKQEKNQAAEGKDNRLQRESSNVSQQSETVGTKRPYPWPEPSPSVFQPRLESSTHARSIGVHSILNPTEGGDSRQVKRPAQDYTNMEILPPPTLSPSPQRRSSSSPLLAPISKSVSVRSAYGTSSVSPPHNPPRRIITPVSPAMRYASGSGSGNNIANGGYSVSVGPEAKVSVSQAPFVPLQELSSAGVYSTPGSGPGIDLCSTTTPRISPQLAIPTPSRSHPPPLQMSRNSTPTLVHSRHPSGGFATNPSSQASSPSTPHSTFSSYAQSSPSIASGLLPPPPGQSSLLESSSQSPFMGMDSLSRTPSRMSASRYGDDHSHPGTPFSAPPDMLAQSHGHPQQQQYGSPMIPLTIDLKSGSRSQAEKRKANSDASRRFRNRKKNEAALEQKINQLNEQLACLTEDRDFYRTERDFYKDALGRHVGTAQMPSRPASPSPSRRYQGSTGSPAAQSEQQATGGEAMSKTVSTGTTSSLASTHILPSPEPLSAAGQHQHQHHPTYPPPQDPWQNDNAANGDYQHAYRDGLRFNTNPRRS